MQRILLDRFEVVGRMGVVLRPVAETGKNVILGLEAERTIQRHGGDVSMGLEVFMIAAVSCIQ